MYLYDLENSAENNIEKDVMEERIKPKPIKRDKVIQPFSRDHHHSLLLCWKIKTGIAKGISFERIKAYCDWFFVTHIHPHFAIEEEHLFPVLGNDHKLVKKALAEHRRLTRLFEDNSQLEKSISLIEEELASHVRFEERVLFNKIQEEASPEQLAHIAEVHKDEEFKENTQDQFWI